MKELKTTKEIQKRLAEQIKSSGLTYSAIDRELGFSIGMTSKYINTESLPSLETFAKLCKIIDASADYILGLTDV